MKFTGTILFIFATCLAYSQNKIVIGNSAAGNVNSGAANQLVYYPANGNTVAPLPSILSTRAIVTNGSGLPVASGTTATELGYISGLTSPLQAQLNAKASLTGTETLINKRINPRIQVIASTQTVTANADNDDTVILTALAGNLGVAAPAGTPVEGQVLTFRIKDNGGQVRNIQWNSIFRPIGATLPAATTLSKTMYIVCIYNQPDSRWDVTNIQIEN